LNWPLFKEGIKKPLESLIKNKKGKKRANMQDHFGDDLFKKNEIFYSKNKEEEAWIRCSGGNSDERKTYDLR
jgi:hypothetical protein